MNDASAAPPQSNPHNPIVAWWADHVVAKVDHDEVVRLVRADSGWSAHFAFMALMSAGIAILGLLLSSPAVVIGAMLISPLMGPIIGIGFALATFDTREIRRSFGAIVAGLVIATAFCALIVVASPLQTVTAEIASRTRPNLFDLLVALLSGLAASYAMIRGRHGAIVGVAIATALMPPIAVMGFGLATGNWRVLSGSALLFFTNFMTIAASAAVLARLYGFATALSPQQTRLQASLLLVSLILLAVPLGLSLRHIAWEALASREARSTISDAFGPEGHISDIAIDFDRHPITVTATVLTPAYRKTAEQAAEASLVKQLGRPVDLSIDQVRTANANADAVEVASANGAAAATDRASTRIAGRLASVAGVDPSNVLIDRQHRIAQVRAVPLPDATLATYREVERRVGASEPDWTIRLVPPLAELPAPGDDGAADLAAWASQRTGVPLELSGNGRSADQLADALRSRGVSFERTAGSGSPVLRWRLALPAKP